MRFSSIFSQPRVPCPPARPEAAEAPPAARLAAPAAACVELPDDLDQRVRLVGEWQLGEAG